MLHFLTITMLKVLFVSILFGIFSWQFAYPSIKKWCESGVLTDKTWKRRETGDSPAITICAQNKITSFGWKHIGDPAVRFKISAFEMFCNNSQDLQEALDCIDKETFNRTETIRNKESDLVRIVSQDEKIWTEDITASYFGRLF